MSKKEIHTITIPLEIVFEDDGQTGSRLAHLIDEVLNNDNIKKYSPLRLKKSGLFEPTYGLETIEVEDTPSEKKASLYAHVPYGFDSRDGRVGQINLFEQIAIDRINAGAAQNNRFVARRDAQGRMWIDDTHAGNVVPNPQVVDPT